MSRIASVLVCSLAALMVSLCIKPHPAYAQDPQCRTDYECALARLDPLEKRLQVILQTKVDEGLRGARDLGSTRPDIGYADALAAYVFPLIESQRVWETYRDTQCEYERSSAFPGGSGWNAFYVGCKASLTEERIKRLGG